MTVMEGGMKRTILSNVYICCGLALALSGAACNGRDSRTADSASAPAGSAARDNGTAARDSGRAANDQAPVTLTGCLQTGDRHTFILTEINRERSIGTTGSDSGATVEREQVHAAAHAYRLSADDDKQLDGLVGHQVRVRGTVTERADLPTGAAEGNPRTDRTDRTASDRAARDRDSGDRRAATNGSETDRTKIDEGDLARLKVVSIDSVADACGGKR
jgi:hypothetical protein